MISTEISPDIAALVDALRGVSPGGSITYAELGAVVNRDIRIHGWLLQRARDVAARDHGVLFGTERGVGVTRLTTEQMPDLAHTARGRLRRIAKRTQRNLKSAIGRANDVSAEVSRKVNAELSVLGLLEHLATDRSAQPQEAHNDRPEPVAVVGARLMQHLTGRAA